MKILLTSLLFGALLVPVAGAQEDLDWILVWTHYPDEAAGARLLVRPDGQGDAFTAARAPGGGTVDATVQIVMTDHSYDPIVGFPAEDLRLSAGWDLPASCAGGMCADGPTDAEGAAYWIAPRRAGGCTAGAELHGVVNGVDLATVIPLTLVSPDLNGDLEVDLTDIVIFTGGLGASCP